MKIGNSRGIMTRTDKEIYLKYALITLYQISHHFIEEISCAKKRMMRNSH